MAAITILYIGWNTWQVGFPCLYHKCLSNTHCDNRYLDKPYNASLYELNGALHQRLHTLTFTHRLVFWRPYRSSDDKRGSQCVSLRPIFISFLIISIKCKNENTVLLFISIKYELNLQRKALYYDTDRYYWDKKLLRYFYNHWKIINLSVWFCDSSKTFYNLIKIKRELSPHFSHSPEHFYTVRRFVTNLDSAIIAEAW